MNDRESGGDDRGERVRSAGFHTSDRGARLDCLALAAQVDARGPEDVDPVEERLSERLSTPKPSALSTGPPRPCAGGGPYGTIPTVLPAPPRVGDAAGRPQAGVPGGKIGVNTKVFPLVPARQGLGGWIEMIARFGNVNRLGGPGGYCNVSMMTRPPLVAMVVRA